VIDSKQVTQITIGRENIRWIVENDPSSDFGLILTRKEISSNESSTEVWLYRSEK